MSASQAQTQREDFQKALRDVVDGRGRRAVLQPIVDLLTGPGAWPSRG